MNITGCKVALIAFCGVSPMGGLGLAEESPAEKEWTWVSPGKPNAPVDLSHSVREAPAAGVPLTIELAVVSRIGADALTLELSFPDSGLTLMSAAGADRIANPQAFERYVRSIRVLPRDDGQFHINVVATLLQDGAPQSRAFSIPIRVGSATAIAPEARGLRTTDHTGRALISLPAIEAGTGL